MNVRDSLLEKFFRLLAGMVSTMKEYAIFIACFSPPYGDCTAIENAIPMEWVFSPPCGDSTLNISQNTAKLKGRMARKHSLYYNDVLLR